MNVAQSCDVCVEQACIWLLSIGSIIIQSVACTNKSTSISDDQIIVYRNPIIISDKLQT